MGSEDATALLSGFFLSLCGFECWGNLRFVWAGRSLFRQGTGDQCVCGGILVVAGPAGWPQSHARQMFQTELSPAASSFLPEAGGKQGFSFCPGQLPGPGAGGWGTSDPQSWPSPGKESALWPHMGVGDGGGPQILHPIASWTQECREPPCHSCATAVAEPGLVTDAVAQPKADRAIQPAHGTQVTPGSTLTHMCMVMCLHNCTPSHSATDCHIHSHVHTRPRPHTCCQSQPRRHSQPYHSTVQGHTHSDTHGHEVTHAHGQCVTNVDALGLHLHRLLGEPAAIIHHLTPPSSIPHCRDGKLEV